MCKVCQLECSRLAAFDLPCTPHNTPYRNRGAMMMNVTTVDLWSPNADIDAPKPSSLSATTKLPPVPFSSHLAAPHTAWTGLGGRVWQVGCWCHVTEGVFRQLPRFSSRVSVFTRSHILHRVYPERPTFRAVFSWKARRDLSARPVSCPHVPLPDASRTRFGCVG